MKFTLAYGVFTQVSDAMKINSQLFIVGAMTLLSTLLCLTYWQYQKKVKDYTELNEKYQAQVIATKQQQEQIKHLAELDKAHTQELANAKTEIDTLRADVAAGRRKLRIQATCPVSETASSGSVVNATTVELPRETGQAVLDTHSLQHLLGNQSFVIDNYDMTMNVVVPAVYLTPFRLHAILQLDILSRPIGVKYQFVVVNSDRPFGWANDAHAFGFGDGKFTRIINVNHQ